jgi:hypothetical protein
MSGEKRFARHREHKIAKAASRLTPSSSIDVPSAKQPRTHRPTTRPDAQSTTRSSAHRYRCPSSQSSPGEGAGAGARTTKRPASAAGAHSWWSAWARSTTSSTSSATHADGHSAAQSQGHEQAPGGPWQGRRRVASRDTETTPAEQRARPSGQSAVFSGNAAEVSAEPTPPRRSPSLVPWQPRSQPANTASAMGRAPRTLRSKRTRQWSRDPMNLQHSSTLRTQGCPTNPARGSRHEVEGESAAARERALPRASF